MVSNQPQNIVQQPELLDTLLALKRDIFMSINCVKPGRVLRFNPTRKTVEVEILLKRLLDDDSIADYPVLVDCPVFTLQGGGAYIQLPIAAGDQCLVLFSDRNIDAWFQNGSAAVPYDGRAHDLSDGFALVGINSLASAMPAYDIDALNITYQGATVALKNGLIGLSNSSTSLYLLMNMFIDLLTTIQVQDSPSPLPLTAASIAALEAFKLQFALLLLNDI